MGKFAMYADWQPDADFQRRRPVGVALREPVTAEELASFVAYWQAEGKVFHHIQWQQNWHAASRLAGPAMAEC